MAWPWAASPAKVSASVNRLDDRLVRVPALLDDMTQKSKQEGTLHFDIK